MRYRFSERLHFHRHGVTDGRGCYEMYEVLQVGGVTMLEWMVLILFVLLFAWIAFSFMSALAGFAVLLFRIRDPLGIDPDAPLPSIESRNAMLLPTYNENPHQIMARLRAMHEALEHSGLWYKVRLVCAERHDQSIDLDRRGAMLSARPPALEARTTSTIVTDLKILARKSGNIEDWIKRFGAAYQHMIVLDADSLMTGETIVRLVSAMEKHPDVALIQTLPTVVNARTLFARLQQFSGTIYGP